MSQDSEVKITTQYNNLLSYFFSQKCASPKERGENNPPSGESNPDSFQSYIRHFWAKKCPFLREEKLWYGHNGVADYMIFPIPVYGNTQVNGKFPSANEKSLYMHGTFKSLEEKPYFRMEYLRLFFTVTECSRRENKIS